ncbi:MAG: ABC transporter permease subunit [Bacteroidetes bacterium]|nr:ABC transporter permease subunit [Bacteroidota bacterium]
MRKVFQFIVNPLFRSKRIPDISSSGNFWSNIKKQFTHNRLGVFSLRFLYFFILISLLADILANEKPLIAKYEGNIYFPVFRSYAVDLGMAQWQKEFQNIEWNHLNYDWKVFPPIPYLPQNMDRNNVHSVSPFGEQHVASLRWRHWLGTDELGRDVLSGMIHGTRTALTVGLVSMGIASLFGILIGALAGYFGDERLKISRAGVVMNVLFFFLAIFWAFIARSYEITDALSVSFGKFFLQILFSVFIMAVTMLVGNILAIPFKFIPFLKKKIFIPVDIILSRFIEIMVSVPTLFLIISISAIVSHPSIYIVMTIIGLTSWPTIARFIRAEMLRIRSLEYIEAAHALGYSEGRVILRHAIPNALSPVLITIAFGIAAAILIESTLSFLGVGVSPETVTWGSLLAEARQTPSAWWLAILPGTAIFLTVTIFNLIGEALTDALDPRQKK